MTDATITNLLKVLSSTPFEAKPSGKRRSEINQNLTSSLDSLTSQSSSTVTRHNVTLLTKRGEIKSSLKGEETKENLVPKLSEVLSPKAPREKGTSKKHVRSQKKTVSSASKKKQGVHQRNTDRKKYSKSKSAPLDGLKDNSIDVGPCSSLDNVLSGQEETKYAWSRFQTSPEPKDIPIPNFVLNKVCPNSKENMGTPEKKAIKVSAAIPESETLKTPEPAVKIDKISLLMNSFNKVWANSA